MWGYLLTDLVLVRCPPPCPSVQLSDKLVRRFLRSLNPQSSSEELQSFDWLSFKSQISNLKSKVQRERKKGLGLGLTLFILNSKQRLDPIFKNFPYK